jgi:hypothetical protein
VYRSVPKSVNRVLDRLMRSIRSMSLPKGCAGISVVRGKTLVTVPAVSKPLARHQGVCRPEQENA